MVLYREMNRWIYFRFEDEGGWPPVGSESVPVEALTDGFRVLVPPIFVRDISVDDVISTQIGDDSRVESWSFVRKSGYTKVCLLRVGGKPEAAIEGLLVELRSYGCATASLESMGAYAIGVPQSLSLRTVDDLLSGLNEDEVAVAFPVLRHDED